MGSCPSKPDQRKAPLNGVGVGEVIQANQGVRAAPETPKATPTRPKRIQPTIPGDSTRTMVGGKRKTLRKRKGKKATYKRKSK